MTFKQFNQRMWIVVAVTLTLLLWLFSTLFDLQINQGEEYYAKAQYKIAETEVVESDRGDILDRNGRILVSNQTIYQVSYLLSPLFSITVISMSSLRPT